MSTTSDAIKQKLTETFGFSEFLEGQAEIVQDLMSGHDVVALRPTGGGKSLCYQLPATLMDSLSIVVCPLIALMNEQVADLRARNIAAEKLHSGQTHEERRRIEQGLQEQAVKILYVAPERFRSTRFQRLISSLSISLFAIDEAHCISEWGHDFRPDYRSLNLALQVLQPEAILACTATATPRVLSDIQHALGLESPKIHVSGFLRTNLHLNVLKVETESERLETLEQLVQQLATTPGRILVYCNTRKQVEAAAKHLQRQQPGIVTTLYHAGLPEIVRDRHQQSFANGKTRVLVATNAFGLGIDRQDIRSVIHFSPPRSIARYYQEVGRAGRDGLPASAIMLFRSKDIGLHRFMIDVNTPSPSEAAAIWQWLRDSAEEGKSVFALAQHAKLKRWRSWEVSLRTLIRHQLVVCTEYDQLFVASNAAEAVQDAQIPWSHFEKIRHAEIAQLDGMRTLLKGTDCFHDMILTHFGDTSTLSRCPGCSNCKDVLDIHDELNALAQAILEAVTQADGSLTVAQLGTGSKTETHAKLLQLLPPKSITDLVDALLDMRVLKEDEGDTRSISLGPKADLYESKKSDSDAMTLTESVQKFRRERAKAMGLTPKQLISDGLMSIIALQQPRNKDEFLSIRGLGLIRWKHYGEALTMLFRQANTGEQSKADVTEASKEETHERGTLSR